MVVDYLSSQPDWAGYQVSTKQGSGPFDVFAHDNTWLVAVCFVDVTG